MSTGINYLTIRDESGKVIHPGELWSPISGCSGKNCPTKDTCWARAWVKWRPAIHGITQGLGGSWAKDDFQPERIPFNQPQFHPDRLEKPLHWKKPRRIGVCYLGDLFDESVPDEWIDDIFDVMAFAKKHTFFVLTKQPERMANFCINSGITDDMSHVYYGVSITSQADEWMIRELLRIPGKHWVSIEPFLSGPIDLRGYLTRPQWGKPNKHNMMPLEIVGRNDLIQWIIIGSHNRPKLHPCPHEWMISVVEQCRAAGVPVWVKAISLNNKITQNIADFPVGLQVREVPK